MTSTGQATSRNPRSLAKRRAREIESGRFPSSPRDKETAEGFDGLAKSMSLPKAPVHMYLRIKPPSAVGKGTDVYRTLNPTTLLTKFPSSESNSRGARTSAKSSGLVGKRHAFTKIFGSESSQAEVFERSIKHRVADFLGGESSTIMTYGTRDSGKTHTLFGTPASPGVIPRSIDLVFSAINCTLTPWYKPTYRDTVYSLDERRQTLEMRRKACVLNERSTDRIAAEARQSLENSRTENADETCDERGGVSMHAVWLSLAEIYNENVYDLLDDATARSPLKVTADDEGQAYVFSLQKVCATTALEACQILAAGRSRLSAAATPSNSKSSRSHVIFTMRLLRYQKVRAPNEVAASTLTFCDLAGSTQFETRQKRSHVREAGNINNSLLVLGKCLKAASQNRIAPFRESKLTRILQRALSGQENLTLITNVAFTPNLSIETQNTFKFCAVARKLLTSHGPREDREESRELERIARSPDACDSDVTAPSSVRRTPAEITGTIDSTAYKSVQEENRKLMKELETTKSDILNREYAIRQELADHYSRVIEELAATYKEHTKGIETERDDLLKWSVKQIESFYKERIDSLARHKKRKRGDSGDYVEDNRALCEELEVENVQIASKVVALKETIKELRKENKALLCEKSERGFELALITEELKKFRELARAGICEWGGDSENIEDTADCLMNRLRQLMEEKVRRAEEKLEGISEYFCATEDRDDEAAPETATMKRELSRSKNILDEALSKRRELEEKLSCKEACIVTLERQVRTQEEQLAQIRQHLKDAQDGNVKSPRCTCDRSTNVSSGDLAIDSSFDGNASIPSAQQSFSRELYTISPAADQYGINNWIKMPVLLSTREHARSPKNKLSSIFDIDRKSFSDGSVDCNVSRSSDRSSKNDSGVSSELRNEDRRSCANDSTRTCESEDKCTQTSLAEFAAEESVDSKRQSQKEMLHVAELSQELEVIRDVIYALNEEACANERKIVQYECQLRHKGRAPAEEEKSEATIECNDLSTIENKAHEREQVVGELTHELIIKERNQRRTSKSAERYVERYKSLEKQLCSMRYQLDKLADRRASVYLPRIDENFEEEWSRRNLQINELNKKIAQMQQNLAIGLELFDKVNDFEIIANGWQKDKNELYRQLHECSETQLILEDKLRKLTMRVTERESKNIRLKSDLCNLTDLNAVSNEKTRNLIKQITEAGESIGSTAADLRCCEDLCKIVENIMKREIDFFGSWFSDYKDNTVFFNKISKAYDDSRDEIIRLNMQLQEKEGEITLLKNNVDVAMQNYETLKGYLQNKIQERNKRFKTMVSSDSKDLNDSKDFEGSLTEKNAAGEDSATSADEKDGAVIKFDDVESRQKGSAVRPDVCASLRETDSFETEADFNVKSPSIECKKRMLGWMKVRRICGKTTLSALTGGDRTDVNNDSENE